MGIICHLILGDPGAVSRVDKMFVVKVYCKIETSPWALTLTEPVPEAFELLASDWPENTFGIGTSLRPQFQQIFNVAKNLEIWRKNNKNGILFDLFVSSLIRISVAFETDIIRISSHFKQLPFAF